MSAATHSVIADPVNAFTFVLRGLARLAERCETLDEGVRERLQAMVRARIDERRELTRQFAEYLARPVQADAALARAARHFALEAVETLAVRLTVAAEEDLMVGHLLAHLQQPLAHSRPTVGLVAQAVAPEDLARAVHTLGQGNAMRCGLLQLCGDDRPLPERQLRIPLPTALALQGRAGSWPGTTSIALEHYPVVLGRTASASAAALARRLTSGSPRGAALVIRSGDAAEARAAAEQVCTHVSMRAILVQTELLSGMAPWLVLNGSLPVFPQWLSPGERKTVPQVPGFDGPIILLTGPDGEFETDDRTVLEWRIETPLAAERADLWRTLLDDPTLAQRLAVEHRHAAGRISLLAAKAREHAQTRAASGSAAVVCHDDVRAVSRRGDLAGLGAMAELISDEVDDAALVVAADLREELESLAVRCRLREQFADSLGASIRTRYRPSVRALFVGPSGTGKTLAVAWLATRLGMPLFRVDLSAITSKYIGETEKNLSQLLARAEQYEVLLLFDEADSLFGKRTDIHDSNDRFANAQTNYLLQRMETYDGITILTSNGRGRFDDAFSRRFDAILSFPLPGPQQRRELWLAHLGADHDVTAAQFNLLAAAAELTGGQIRNAVLRGAVAAAQGNTPVLYRHLLVGVASEYRKSSRQLPNELKQSQGAARG